jgi:hypothetical protein
MRPFKIRPLILSALLLIGATIVFIGLQSGLINNSSSALPTTTSIPTHRELWDSWGASKYVMVIETIALPQPPVGLELTIEDGEISNRSIIACDNPSGDYPAHYCETIQQYYSWVGNYTVEELFETADMCLAQTRTSLSKCSSSVTNGFDDFPDAERMLDTVRQCEVEFEDTDYFCAVKYHPHFGYPRDISIYNPSLLHGFTSITVKSLTITQ